MGTLEVPVEVAELYTVTYAALERGEDNALTEVAKAETKVAEATAPVAAEAVEDLKAALPEGYALGEAWYTDADLTAPLPADAVVSGDMALYIEAIAPAEEEEVEEEPEDAPEGAIDTGIMTLAGSPVNPIESSYTIYLYIKLTGDGADAFMNKYKNNNGYITVGSISVPANQLPNSGNVTHDGNPVQNTVGTYINDHRDDITYVSSGVWVEANISANDIDWATGASLIAAKDGAEGFGVQYDCWHLDGTLEIKNEVTVTVHYVDEDGNEIATAPAHTEKKRFDETYDMSEFVKKEIAGYLYDYTSGNATSGTIYGTDIDIYVHYYKPYTVTYTDGANGAVFADEVHTSLKKNTPIPQFNNGTSPSREGYEFTGWSPDNSGVVTGDATYTAKWRKLEPKLSITKTASKTAAKVGDLVTFTITVENTGEADAQNVTVTDELPEGFEALNGKTKLDWTVNVPVNGKQTMTVTGIMSATGEITNTATYKYGDETKSDNATVTVTDETDPEPTPTPETTYSLTVIKQVKGDVPEGNVNYSFTVSYDGEEDNFELQKDGRYTTRIPKGTEVTITENVPADADYEPVGGATQTVTMNANQIVTVINLYDNEPETEYTYSLTYNDNGENVNNMPENVTEQKSANPSYTFTLSGAPTCAGYVFKGWSVDPNGTTGVNEVVASVLHPAVTVYAIWAEDKNGDNKADNEQNVVINIKGRTVTEIYNGNTHKAEGYDISIMIDDNVKGTNLSALPAGVSLTLNEVSVEKINAGEYPYLTADTVDVTNEGLYNVTLNVESGLLKIDPAQVNVTITGQSRTRSYDGIAYGVYQTATTAEALYEISIAPAEFEKEVEITHTAAIEEKHAAVGIYPQNLASVFTVTSTDNVDVNVAYVNGGLTITPVTTTPTDPDPDAPDPTDPDDPGPVVPITPPVDPGTPVVPGPGPAPVVPGVVIDADDTPLGEGPEDVAADAAEAGDDYSLDASGAEGTVTIEEDDTALGLLDITENCCILHLLIMLLALAVAVYYTHNSKKHQSNQFELRRELGNA